MTSSATPALASNPALVAPSLRRRIACWLYEGVLLFAVVFVAGFVFSTVFRMQNAMDPNRPLLQAFVFAVFGGYFTGFWSRGRQTLAMKTWHIRLVDLNGRPVTASRALLRYVLAWIWFLPPLAVIAPFGLRAREIAVLAVGWVLVWALLSRFHPQRQFWHDAWAGTRLVSAT